MIKTLARIASHTAKGIYALLFLNGGFITRKELMEAGYPSTLIHENMLKLEAGGSVIKITSGVYRVADYSGMPKESFRPPKEEETFGMPKESYGMPKTEQILESASNKKCFGIPKESSAPPKAPVNVVNNMLTNKQANGRIKSTAEIGAIPADSPLYQKCGIYEKMLKIDMPDLSRDVITRIVLAQEILNAEITLDTINDWRKEAINAEKTHRVKKAYMAFANNVKTFYEQHGVKWTKCTPNNIREIEKQLGKIATLNTPVTVQGEPTGETIAGYISDGRIQKISIDQVRDLLDPPPPKTPQSKRKKG